MTTGQNGTQQADISDSAAVRGATAVAGEFVTELTLQSGIVLRLKPVSPAAIRAASSRVPMPSVPIVHLEESNRDEPNPNDPDYLRMLIEWQLNQASAAQTVALLLGTEIISVPEGWCRPEEQGWIDELRAVYAITGLEGIELHEEPPMARYLDWLRLYAMTTEIDTYIMTRILTLGVLLTEEEVAQHAASFRRDHARITDSRDTTPAEPADGDSLPTAGAGDSLGVRGAESGPVGELQLDGVANPPA